MPSEGMEGYTPIRPRVNARVPQYVLPIEISRQRAILALSDRHKVDLEVEAAQLVYEPYLIGLASVLYSDAKRVQTKQERVGCLLPLPDLHGLIEWEQHLAPDLESADLQAQIRDGALFGDLPDGMAASPPYTQFRNDFTGYIYRERPITIWVHPVLKLRSRIGESEREFKERCQEEARKRRDAELAKVEAKFERGIKRLNDKLDREEQELEEDRIDYKGRQQEELLSAGETVFSFLTGRRRSSSLSTASRRRRMTQKAKEDVRESEEAIEELQKEIEEMRQDREQALKDVRDKWADVALQIEETALRPKKADILMEAFGLAWVPHWMLHYKDAAGALHHQSMPAYPVP